MYVIILDNVIIFIILIADTYLPVYGWFSWIGHKEIYVSNYRIALNIIFYSTDSVSFVFTQITQL